MSNIMPAANFLIQAKRLVVVARGVVDGGVSESRGFSSSLDCSEIARGCGCL